MSKYKYTVYSTILYIEKYKEVLIWDEIKDKRVQKIKVESKDEAEKIMNDWLEKAPKNCICEKV